MSWTAENKPGVDGQKIDRQGDQLHYTPQVEVFSAQKGVDLFAANNIIETLHQNPRARLLLPTGRRVRAMYEFLVEAFRQGNVSFREATVFNLDEYWPLKQEHPASYHSFMRENLMQHIDLPPEQWFIPNGEAADHDVEAERYAELLAATGGVDLAVLGIGPGKTCHIGFNEAGSAVDSRTRYVQIEGETAATNSLLFPDPDEFPNGAITTGVSEILAAKRILLLARGQDKAWGVNRSLRGPIGVDAPASLLRLHPQVTFVLDAVAASLLQSE